MKAVITAAAPSQRHIPHQTLTNPDGSRQSILEYLLDLLHGAVEQTAVIVARGDSGQFAAAASRPGVTLIEQSGPRGYLDAILGAREFTGDGPFVHLVGDHFYLAGSGHPRELIRSLLRVYERHGVSVSAVTPTHESQLAYFGAAGGPAAGEEDGVRLHQVEAVAEKPTPTEAERELVSPGLRAGYYLCFFGMHVFSPSLMPVLAELAGQQSAAGLTDGLRILARRERLLAAVLPGRRFDIGAKYGLLEAQLALALSGPDRGEVLEMALRLVAR